MLSQARETSNEVIMRPIMLRVMKQAVVVAALLGSIPASVAAQRHYHEAHEHKNEAAFFLGVTSETATEEVESFFNFGGEYEYRFLPGLGISAEVEYVTDVESSVFALL